MESDASDGLLPVEDDIATDGTTDPSRSWDAGADFVGDLHECLLSLVPHHPSDRDAVAVRSVEDLLLDYLTWSERKITPRPRRVHLSDALRTGEHLHRGEISPGLRQVLYLARTGGDLSPYLSKQTKYAYARRKRPNKPLKRGLDLLLHAWGIHHLHLSMQHEDDGFAVRTEQVLMVIVRQADFFAIDVVVHDSGDSGDPHWTVNEELLRTVARSWPTVDLLNRSMIATGLAGPPHSPDDLLQLRKAHVSTFHAFDGAVFHPRLLSIAGTPMDLGERAAQLLSGVRELQERLSRDGGTWFRRLMTEEAGLLLPASPRWTLGIDQGVIALTEHSSDLLVRCRDLTLA
ncbi:hypothetical protein OG218_24370 [Kineococcus sp. NBC_00420]|uniref:hypothetical protein n=1 Tax=Kineococcus sp. NBC_00420 TaxID=2903564 RepID=UPI002E215505